MNIAICDIRKGKRDPRNSITVAYRNLMVLKKSLNADLFVQVKDINWSKQYDAIICGFGSTSCECDKQLKFLKENKNAKLLWLVGDYEQSTFAPLFYTCRDQGRKVEIIKAFKPSLKCSYASKQHVIDINTLLVQKPNKVTEKIMACAYWGRWRNDRLVYFQKYLKNPVMCSTSSKNIKKFHQNNCSPKYIKPLTWTRGAETLNRIAFSLYIEDVYSNQNYTSVANRFYEALACNVAQLFDKSCVNTLKECGYSLDSDMVIDGHTELVSKLIPEKYQEIMSRQTAWNELAYAKKDVTLNQIRALVS
jgi:hypothetical protein